YHNHDVRAFLTPELVLKSLDASGLDISCKDPAVGSDLARQSRAQSTFARADIGDRHSLLEEKRLRDALHFRSSRIEAEAGPTAAGRHKRRQQQKCRAA